MGHVMLSAESLSSVVNAMPTAVAVAVLCVAVAAEIVVVPVIILPGATMTLLAGALIGAGRPALEVAAPVSIAVIAADQIAYFGGAVVISWWHRRHQERAGNWPGARRGRAAKWLTATMPALAGATGMPYPEFVPRLLAMRLPWLAAALTGGTLAADSLREIGHVAGVAGLIASFIVIVGLVLVRRRPRALRDLARWTAAAPRALLSCSRVAGRR